MTKHELVATIIARLEADLELFTAAALHAHRAATHEECRPDNKYDTTALEASYIAQGQANRAQVSARGSKPTAAWNCRSLTTIRRCAWGPW